MSMIISERIKKRRMELGLRQDDIANKLGMNRVSFAHYESGKSVPPSNKLSMLVDILHTNADYLLGKTDDHYPRYGDQLGLDIDFSKPSEGFVRVNGYRMQKARKEKGVILDQLCMDLNLSPRQYASWERSFGDMRPETLNKLSYYLNVDEEHLLDLSDVKEYEDEKEVPAIGIPLIGTICAGDGLLAEQNIEDYVIYPFYNNKIKSDYALRVKGDSMTGAGIDDGDIVFFRKAEWADYSGQIVAAIINDLNDGTLKRIKWSEGSNKVQLLPENDEFESIEVFPNQVKICGVYMGHFKPEKHF